MDSETAKSTLDAICNDSNQATVGNASGQQTPTTTTTNANDINIKFEGPPTEITAETTSTSPATTESTTPTSATTRKRRRVPTTKTTAESPKEEPESKTILISRSPAASQASTATSVASAAGSDSDDAEVEQVGSVKANTKAKAKAKAKADSSANTSGTKRKRKTVKQLTAAETKSGKESKSESEEPPAKKSATKPRKASTAASSKAKTASEAKKGTKSTKSAASKPAAKAATKTKQAANGTDTKKKATTTKKKSATSSTTTQSSTGGSDLLRNLMSGNADDDESSDGGNYSDDHAGNEDERPSDMEIDSDSEKRPKKNATKSAAAKLPPTPMTKPASERPKRKRKVIDMATLLDAERQDSSSSSEDNDFDPNAPSDAEDNDSKPSNGNEDGSDDSSSSSDDEDAAASENKSTARAKAKGKADTNTKANAKGKQTAKQRTAAASNKKPIEKQETLFTESESESDSDNGSDDSDDSSEDEESKIEKSAIIARKDFKVGKRTVTKYLLKPRDKSYLHTFWARKTDVESKSAMKSRVSAFLRKYPEKWEEDEELFNPENTKIDRIISEQTYKKQTMYLVKWKGLGYDECAWELESDLRKLDEFAEKLQFFEKYNVPPRSEAEAAPGERPHPSSFEKIAEAPVFKDGNTLREYQLEGLNWLLFCWASKRNCILADEMGLGKTIQTITALEHLRTHHNWRGPILVVAPLSTLINWQREFEAWSDMYCIVYNGGAEARQVIRRFEWKYRAPPKSKKTAQGSKAFVKDLFKFNVLITSYETALADDYLAKINWQYIVLDEAHRVKKRGGKTHDRLRSFKSEQLILLTGTPLQNDLIELWNLLNFIEPTKFDSLDSFMKDYGDLTNSEQVERLQRLLSPYVLRRLKEHVEADIPRKEETIIDVVLTSIQKQYYRAIIEKNRDFLSRAAKVSATSANGQQTPPPKYSHNLISIFMEIRKCCNHPFLIAGAEDMIKKENDADTEDQVNELMIKSSSKLILTDKLLQKLNKNPQNKVLIFSQMLGILDIFEDYLTYRGWKYARLDGQSSGVEKQAAIDTFNRDPECFVFLLSTRAGGVGINLTSANTVIIYDSDWNPQNDMQAQSRCHRIGQKQEVQVFRLVTKNTYEKYMIEIASKKLGLEQAVLRNMKKGSGGSGSGAAGGSGSTNLDNEEVEALLKFGAYSIYMNEQDQDEKLLYEEDIDQILQTSSTVVSWDNAEAAEDAASTSTSAAATAEEAPVAGKRGLLSGLSKASFVAAESEMNVDLYDKNFWEKILPEFVNVDGLIAKYNDPETFATDDSKKKFFDDLKKVVDETVASMADETSAAAADASAATATTPTASTPTAASDASSKQSRTSTRTTLSASLNSNSHKLWNLLFQIHRKADKFDESQRQQALEWANLVEKPRLRSRNRPSKQKQSEDDTKPSKKKAVSKKKTNKAKAAEQADAVSGEKGDSSSIGSEASSDDDDGVSSGSSSFSESSDSDADFTEKISKKKQQKMRAEAAAAAKKAEMEAAASAAAEESLKAAQESEESKMDIDNKPTKPAAKRSAKKTASTTPPKKKSTAAAKAKKTKSTKAASDSATPTVSIVHKPIAHQQLPSISSFDMDTTAGSGVLSFQQPTTMIHPPSQQPQVNKLLTQVTSFLAQMIQNGKKGQVQESGSAITGWSPVAIVDFYWPQPESQSAFLQSVIPTAIQVQIVVQQPQQTVAAAAADTGPVTLPSLSPNKNTSTVDTRTDGGELTIGASEQQPPPILPPLSSIIANTNNTSTTNTNAVTYNVPYSLLTANDAASVPTPQRPPLAGASPVSLPPSTSTSVSHPTSLAPVTGESIDAAVLPPITSLTTPPAANGNGNEIDSRFVYTPQHLHNAQSPPMTLSTSVPITPLMPTTETTTTADTPHADTASRVEVVLVDDDMDTEPGAATTSTTTAERTNNNITNNNDNTGLEQPPPSKPETTVAVSGANNS